MKTFICKRCKQEKGEVDYQHRNSYKDRIYRSSICKKCCVDIGSENRRKFRNISPEEYSAQRRESARKYRKNHPGKHYSLVRRWRERKRKEMLDLLGGERCSKCGFSDKRALQIDHINGGGNKVRTKLKYTALSVGFMLREVKQYGKDKYQVLCANCNWIKRHENNEMRRRY